MIWTILNGRKYWTIGSMKTISSFIIRKKKLTTQYLKQCMQHCDQCIYIRFHQNYINYEITQTIFSNYDNNGYIISSIQTLNTTPQYYIPHTTMQQLYSQQPHQYTNSNWQQNYVQQTSIYINHANFLIYIYTYMYIYIYILIYTHTYNLYR